MRAPGLIKNPETASEHLGAGVEHRIAAAGAELHGPPDGRYAAVRIDEAKRTDEATQRIDPRSGQPCFRRASRRGFVRVGALEHLAEPVVCIADPLPQLNFQFVTAARRALRNE